MSVKVGLVYTSAGILRRVIVVEEMTKLTNQQWTGAGELLLVVDPIAGPHTADDYHAVLQAYTKKNPRAEAQEGKLV